MREVTSAWAGGWVAGSLRVRPGVTSVPSCRPRRRLVYRSSPSKRAALRRSLVGSARCQRRWPAGLTQPVPCRRTPLHRNGVFEVADQLAENPGLVRVCHAPVLLLDRRLQRGPTSRTSGADRPSGASACRSWSGAGQRCWDLVADGDEGLEALLPRDIEVGLELLGLELVRAGLDLDQRGPGACRERPGSAHPGSTLLAEQEGHLDVALQGAGWGPEVRVGPGRTLSPFPSRPAGPRWLAVPAPPLR